MTPQPHPDAAYYRLHGPRGPFRHQFPTFESAQSIRLMLADAAQTSVVPYTAVGKIPRAWWEAHRAGLC